MPTERATPDAGPDHERARWPDEELAFACEAAADGLGGGEEEEFDAMMLREAAKRIRALSAPAPQGEAERPCGTCKHPASVHDDIGCQHESGCACEEVTCEGCNTRWPTEFFENGDELCAPCAIRRAVDALSDVGRAIYTRAAPPAPPAVTEAAHVVADFIKNLDDAYGPEWAGHTIGGEPIAWHWFRRLYPATLRPAAPEGA